MGTLKFVIVGGVMILMALLTACSQKPVEIHYGNEECAYCKMNISNNRFASQAVTETGKAIKFDAIECMANYTKEHKSELKSARFWVNDFSTPGKWVEAKNANFVKSEVVKSPMGESLLAFEEEKEMKEHLSEYPGKPIEWQRLVNQ